MSAAIARLIQDVRDGDLFRTDRPTGGKRAESIGMTPGEEAAARGRAVRMGRMETIKPQSRGSHFIEHRCLHMRMAVVAGLFPAMIVAHHEYKVGSIRGDSARSTHSCNTKHESERNACLKSMHRHAF